MELRYKNWERGILLVFLPSVERPWGIINGCCQYLEIWDSRQKYVNCSYSL